MKAGFTFVSSAIISAILLISCSPGAEYIEHTTKEDLEAQAALEAQQKSSSSSKQSSKPSSSSETLSSSSDTSSSSSEAGSSSSSIQSSSSNVSYQSSSSSSALSSSSSLTLCEYAANTANQNTVTEYSLAVNARSYKVFYKDGFFAMGEPLAGGNMYDWILANGACEGLEDGNWRLPTAEEAYHYEDFIISKSALGSSHFWTSTYSAEPNDGTTAIDGYQYFYMGDGGNAIVIDQGHQSGYPIGAVCVKRCGN